MGRATVVILTFLVVGLILVAPAFAQDSGYDSQLFRPSIFGGNFVAIEGVRTLWPLCGGIGLYVNYADSPVEVRIEDEFDTGIVNSVLSTNLTGYFSPFWWWGIGADIPVHYARAKDFEDVESQGISDAELTSQAMLGDIKAEMRFAFTQVEKQYVGFAIAPFAHFPTGNPDMFLGEGQLYAGGKILMEINAAIFNIAANGGYAYRNPRDIFGTEIGNAYIYGLGVGDTYDMGLGWSLEWWGTQFDSSSNDRLQADPMEVTATLRYTLPNKIRFIVGGGSGVSSGVGSPSYRGLAGIDWHPECIPPSKGTLIINVKAEDTGAPLEAALVIKRTRTATVKTGPDGTYTAEAAAGEYKVSAATKGYLPGTGVGIVKVGKITTIDVVLKPKPKPTILTVRVVHKKTGEPVPNAGIMIKNTQTGKVKGLKAPEGVYSDEKAQVGTYEVTAGAKAYETIKTTGVVEPQQENVIIVKLRKKIPKIGKVQFAFDSAQLLPAAFPVLDDVIKKIELTDVKFKKIVIEGHTSDEGSDEYNMNLSRRRAESVKKYLVSKGIAADILEVQPFGESQPITSNETEEGREINRRVEFIFEE